MPYANAELLHYKNTFITRLQYCDRICGSNILLFYPYWLINSSVLASLEIWGRLHLWLGCGLYKNSLQIAHWQKREKKSSGLCILSIQVQFVKQERKRTGFKKKTKPHQYLYFISRWWGFMASFKTRRIGLNIHVSAWTRYNINSWKLGYCLSSTLEEPIFKHYYASHLCCLALLWGE